MKGFWRVIGILVLVSLMHLVSFGQDRPINTEYNIWTAVKLQKKINKKFTASITQALRTEEYVSEISRIFTQVDLKYGILKWLDVKSGYRLAYGHHGYNRFFGQSTVKLGYKRWELKWRNKFEFNDPSREKRDNTRRLRERLKLGYNVPKTKIEPSIFAEWFYLLDEKLGYEDLMRIRVGIDVDIPLNKRHYLSVELLGQDTYKSKKINRDIVLSTSYKYKF